MTNSNTQTLATVFKAVLTDSIYGGNGRAFVLEAVTGDKTEYHGRIDIPRSTGDASKDASLLETLEAQIESWTTYGPNDPALA